MIRPPGRPRGRGRFGRLGWLGWLGGAVALGLLVVYSPAEAGWFPRCPFNLLTGLYCPGCGATRAAHELLTGHLGESFARHPLFPPAVAVLVVLLARRWWLSRSGQPHPLIPESWFARPWVTWAALAFTLAFTVARNLPGQEWLSPA